MSNPLNTWLVVVLLCACIGVISVFVGVLVVIVLRAVRQITETNKQLLILVAGQSGEPKTTVPVMRALVASEKPPQGKLRGVDPEKKKDKKIGSTNTDYELSVGVG